MKRMLLTIAMVIFCFGIGRATDYYVAGKNGSNTSGDGSQAKPWQSITYALTQVATGAELHTIHVAEAVYDTTLETFPIRMKNKVSLVGAGRDVTVLDAKGTGTVIVCEAVTNTQTRIEGFTITGGRVSAGEWIDAGGINLKNSSPIIVNNIIISNVGDPRSAAGIMCYGSSSIIESNIISNNTGLGNNTVHGILVVNIEGSIGKPIISNNTIEKHTEAGIAWRGGLSLIQGNLIRLNTYGIECESGVTIEANVISENHEGIHLGYVSANIEKNIIAHNIKHGVFLWGFGSGKGPGPVIINNTIDANGSDGICLSSEYDNVDISLVKNNIISNNTGYGMSEKGWPSYQAQIKSVQFNLFYNNTAGHYLDRGTQTTYTNVALMDSLLQECQWNLEGDPMFVDAANNNYHLKPGSPAINSGDPSGPLDPDGTRADIGALPLFDWSGPPNTPRNLRAFSGHAQITLLWSPIPDEDLACYTIYRSQTSGFIPSINDSIAKVNSPDTTYLDKGLRNGTTYYYRICAVDSTGKKSDFTSQVSATPTFNPNFLLVTFPTHGAFVNKTPVLVKGIAITPHVKKVEINGAQVPIINDSFEMPINLNEGPNQIRVVGYDSLNAVAKEIKLTVKLDSTLPRVKITSPHSGQSFSYSPVQIKGTIVERNLVSLRVNSIKPKISGTNFVLGEGHAQGLEIEEGQFWIKAIAIDSAGNTSADSVRINGVPPSPRRLYLKDDILSWFPFPPYPSGTTEGYSQVFIFDQYNWKFPLNGDINGSNYQISLLVGCFGLGSAEMRGELILRQGGKDTKLVTTPNFIGNMAGWTPFGYQSPSRKQFTIAGINPNSSLGDTLIFKVTKVGGDRVGLIFIQELYLGQSWVTIPPIVPDSSSPAPIADLYVSSKADSSVTLKWTAPGDDGHSGKASLYDLRYSVKEIGNDTTSWWANASKVANMPKPSVPGSIDSVTAGDLDPNLRYYFAIKTADEVPNWSKISNVVPVKTPVEQFWFVEIPKTFELSQNYPNPFNPETTIRYQLPKMTNVTLQIFNMVGQLVRTLVDERQLMGYYAVIWNGKDQLGRDVASGIYFYNLKTNDLVQTRKMLLVR